MITGTFPGGLPTFFPVFAGVFLDFGKVSGFLEKLEKSGKVALWALGYCASPTVWGIGKEFRTGNW
jgi:hypothetical protein